MFLLTKIHMVQNNTQDLFRFQSAKGYGLFWDNYSPTTFSDNGSKKLAGGWRWHRLLFYVWRKCRRVVAQMGTYRAGACFLVEHGYWQQEHTKLR